VGEIAGDATSPEGSASQGFQIRIGVNTGFRNGPLVVKSLVSTSAIYGAPRERAVDCALASAANALGHSESSIRNRRSKFRLFWMTLNENAP
jgi:hypothetical protein